MRVSQSTLLRDSRRRSTMHTALSMKLDRHHVVRLWRKLESGVASRVRFFNPLSLDPGSWAYWAASALVTLWWCAGRVEVWLIILRRSRDFPSGLTVSSGTVTSVSIGLAAIPLALTILLGEIYSGQRSRLRVILYESRVQLSLVTAVVTAIATALIGGRFLTPMVVLGLGVVGVWSCKCIIRAFDLLQRPDAYADAWGQFIAARQSAIAVNSARRGQEAHAATGIFMTWGADVTVDSWFVPFHHGTTDEYTTVPARATGSVDTVDAQALYRILTSLRDCATNAYPRATVASSGSDTTISDVKDVRPLLVICHLPGDLVDSPAEALALFRKDIIPDGKLQKRLEHDLWKAFRVDRFEGLSRIIGDLRSEARELGHQLMQGVHTNDPGPIAEFQEVTSYIIRSFPHMEEFRASESAQQTYRSLLDALVWATDDARNSVDRLAAETDREVRSLVMSLPRNLAYSAAASGYPEVFERCLSPLLRQCRDMLQLQPAAPDTRYCLSWYGVLFSAIQDLAETNAGNRAGKDSIVSETRLLLQSLSTLLLLLVRQSRWDAANLVVDEISQLSPESVARANRFVASREYRDHFEALRNVLYFGVHACLIDLVVAEPAVAVPSGLLEVTWPGDTVDLAQLLDCYTQARSQGNAGGSNWGWEPPQPPMIAYRIRTDDVLALGFVALAITLPGPVLYQDSPDWLSAEAARLEQAAGGASELEELLGQGSLPDRVLRDAARIAKLVAAVSENYPAADQSAKALGELLRHLQKKMADERLDQIRSAQVPQDTIQSYVDNLLQQYDTNYQAKIAILERLEIVSTGPRPSGEAEERSFGFNKLVPKQWLVGKESESRAFVTRQYADGLYRGEQKGIIDWLAGISSPIETASVLASDSRLERSKYILLVNANVYLFSSSLKASVEIPQSANLGHGDPVAFFGVSGNQVPIFQFGIHDTEPCLLFIDISNTAHVIRVPWDAEEGWTFSATREVEARLRVLSQDADGMNRLLEDDPDWLRKEGQTPEAKKAFLESQAWLEVYLRLVFDAGSHPSILRLGLARGENLE